MKIWWVSIACLVAAWSLPGIPAAGDVVVITNRAPQDVAFTLSSPSIKTQQLTLIPYDLVPVPCVGKVNIKFQVGEKEVEYLLDANSAYFFTADDGKPLELQRIDLGGDERTFAGRGIASYEQLQEVVAIPIKVLVDDEERAARKSWEARLRKRIAAASDILEKHCRVRLEIVAFDKWTSDNSLTDVKDSLLEFEQKVDPSPARVAIGFTGEFHPAQGRVHLGGTRGPLRRHILIREWWPSISEPERLEILVHELGHFLGAAHSPEPDSVMRPLLGDRKARLRQFRIGFDPVNTLAMCLVSEEFRVRQVQNVSQLSPPTRLRLRQLYHVIATSLPSDPAAGQFETLIELAEASPLAVGTRRVVRSIVEAAQQNAELPESVRRSGDALTDYYVQRAAGAARELPESIGPSAFLLALGIALDDSDLLVSNVLTKTFCASVESPTDRSARLKVLGSPTMQRRRDLAQHFVISAYLAVSVGEQAAELAGWAKEFSDANGGSGFSYADLAADKAGVQFARSIKNRKLDLAELAGGFTVARYMPSVDGLPEGISAAKLGGKQASDEDKRQHEQLLAEIQRRLAALPSYPK